MKQFVLLASCFALAVASAVFAADPPLAPASDFAHERDLGELSVAFWVRFDKLPSEGEPIGLVGCKADSDGRITVTFPAQPTEFQDDFELRSKRTIRQGEWVHVEFNYSLMMHKTALYLDGRIQWENDNVNLPKLRLRPLVVGEGFAGSVRDRKQGILPV